MNVQGSVFNRNDNAYWLKGPTTNPSNLSYSYETHNQQGDGLDGQSKALASAGILQIIAMGLQKASQWCSNKLMAGKEFASAEDVKKVADSMVNKHNLGVTVDYIDQNNYTKYSPEMREMMKTVAKGENAFYLDSAKLAVAPKSKPSLILHELGHAINATKGKVMRFLQKSRAYVAAVPAALVYLNKIFKKDDGQPTVIEKYAGLIGFSAFLPTIIEEGLASMRGVNAAKNVLGKAANLKPLKRNYFTAWLTYLISGLGLGVAAKQCVLQNKDAR